MSKFLFGLFFFIPFICESQEYEWVLQDSIQKKIDHFSIDNVGNIYMSHKDVIVKLSPKLDTLFSGSLKAISPQYIEASKNFRLMLFDKERGVVQFLDNTLTDISGVLDLYALDVVEPILVCESFNGDSFWILDAGAYTLLKVNQKMEVINQIDNLRFLSETKKRPSQMLEYNDRLYVLIPNESILVFDIFGTYLKTIPYSGTWMDVHGKNILSYTYPNYTLYTYPLMDQQASYFLPVKSVLGYRFSQKKLYFHTKNGLMIYKLTKKKPTNNK